MKSDVEKLDTIVKKVSTASNDRDYFILNESLARAIAMLDGRDAQIALLKDQLDDYREPLTHKETL